MFQTWSSLAKFIQEKTTTSSEFQVPESKCNPFPYITFCPGFKPGFYDAVTEIDNPHGNSMVGEYEYIIYIKSLFLLKHFTLRLQSRVLR